jgi:hypothetical protein
LKDDVYLTPPRKKIRAGEASFSSKLTNSVVDEVYQSPATTKVAKRKTRKELAAQRALLMAHQKEEKVA